VGKNVTVYQLASGQTVDNVNITLVHLNSKLSMQFSLHFRKPCMVLMLSYLKESWHFIVLKFWR